MLIGSRTERASNNVIALFMWIKVDPVTRFFLEPLMKSHNLACFSHGSGGGCDNAVIEWDCPGYKSEKRVRVNQGLVRNKY